MADLFDNPMGTDGFEFVEYTAPDTQALGQYFESLGFRAVARRGGVFLGLERTPLRAQ